MELKRSILRTQGRAASGNVPNTEAENESEKKKPVCPEKLPVPIGLTPVPEDDERTRKPTYTVMKQPVRRKKIVQAE